MNKDTDNYTFAVYGTLRRGQGNHSLLKDFAVHLGDARIEGYNMYHLGGFPGVKKGIRSIYVEIWRAKKGNGPDVLKNLDRLEGHPNFYKRELVKAAGFGEAWLYIYQNSIDSSAVIDNGDWVNPE